MVEAMKPVKRYGHLTEDEVADLYDDLQEMIRQEEKEKAAHGGD